MADNGGQADHAGDGEISAVDPQATCSIRTYCAAQSRRNICSERWKWHIISIPLFAKLPWKQCRNLWDDRERPFHWLAMTLKSPFADQAIRPNAELSANAWLSDMKRHLLPSTAWSSAYAIASRRRCAAHHSLIVWHPVKFWTVSRFPCPRVKERGVKMKRINGSFLGHLSPALTVLAFLQVMAATSAQSAQPSSGPPKLSNAPAVATVNGRLRWPFLVYFYRFTPIADTQGGFPFQTILGGADDQ
jgi:hypothetical protein